MNPPNFFGHWEKETLFRLRGTDIYRKQYVSSEKAANIFLYSAIETCELSIHLSTYLSIDMTVYDFQYRVSLEPNYLTDIVSRHLRPIFLMANRPLSPPSKTLSPTVHMKISYPSTFPPVNTQFIHFSKVSLSTCHLWKPLYSPPSTSLQTIQAIIYLCKRGKKKKPLLNSSHSPSQNLKSAQKPSRNFSSGIVLFPRNEISRKVYCQMLEEIILTTVKDDIDKDTTKSKDRPLR